VYNTTDILDETLAVVIAVSNSSTNIASNFRFLARNFFSLIRKSSRNTRFEKNETDV